MNTEGNNDVSKKYKIPRRRNKKPGPIATDVIKKGLCSICREQDSEISMTCAGMHSFCFECVKEWFISKKEISCPACRKVSTGIIVLPIENQLQSEELKKFKESVNIIPNPKKHGPDCQCFDDEFKNTSIYPDWTIQNFVENTNQLNLYYKNCNSFDKSALINIINWTISQQSEESSQ